MSPKTLTLIIVIGIILAVGIGLGVWYWRNPNGSAQDQGQSPESQAPIKTMTQTTENIIVPETTSTLLPPNMAKPATVVEAAPDANTKFRVFNLAIENNKVTPDTMAVYIGDTLRINITAQDKNYDLVQPDYSLRQDLPKGVKRVIQFDATNLGKFTFYCESCGGPEKGPLAYLEVVNK